MFFLISAHSTATPGVPVSPYRTQVSPYPPHAPQLSQRISRQTRPTAYKPFTPNNSGQRSHPTYYRGCWHVVSRCFFTHYPHHNLELRLDHERKRFTTRRPSSLTRRRCIRLSPIVQYSPLLPPVGRLGRISSPNVTGHPLRPATRQSLGRPSPHQQADRPRAHPPPEKTFPPTPMRRPVNIQVLAPRFRALSQRRGQVTHVLLTRSPLINQASLVFSFDLHVLSTPPAFVLSQDQTLQDILKLFE